MKQFLAILLIVGLLMGGGVVLLREIGTSPAATTQIDFHGLISFEVPGDWDYKPSPPQKKGEFRFHQAIAGRKGENRIMAFSATEPLAMDVKEMGLTSAAVAAAAPLVNRLSDAGAKSTGLPVVVDLFSGDKERIMYRFVRAEDKTSTLVSGIVFRTKTRIYTFQHMADVALTQNQWQAVAHSVQEAD